MFNMASTHVATIVYCALFLSGLTYGTDATSTPSATTLTTSTVSDFAPGVTPPPNQPLPPLKCPRPTQKYCYWEPDVLKDEYYTCWRSGILYTSSSYEVQSSVNLNWTTRHTLASTTDYSYSTAWNPDVSFSTLCDGHARAPPGATPTITTITKVSPCTTNTVRCVSVEVNPDTSNLPWPTPLTCTIPEKECAYLSHAYQSMTTSFHGGWYSSQIPLGLWQAPPCTVDYSSFYPQTTCEPPSPSRVACSIYPGEMTMLYWPTAASTSLCNTQNQTLATDATATNGPEKTAVYDGKTLTSPTAYMILGSMRNLQTVSISGHTERGWCGPSQPPITLSIPPESVSKKVWRHGTELHTESFDFRDVNTISYEAYVDEVCGWGTMRQRVQDDCKTVWGEYSPTIVVPPRVTEAAKNWEGCDITQLSQVKEWVPLDDIPSERENA
ncbi:unnamed protein product [Periconia digitata]|uniref:Uncharacterized protein n=1 Tax=Periconia digitata TaxID=1303443 RepID=A0A9W4XT09_9PLEO|nr:unnamed protein product [Periconia digitata]